MVELYWPRRGRFRDTERDFLADDEGVYDVDDDAEEQYRSRGWEHPDEADGEDSDEADASDAGSADESAEQSDESGEFDAEAWLDRSYQDRKQAVQDGDVDDHLDAIEDAETSENVQEAVEERRAELEE